MLDRLAGPVVVAVVVVVVVVVVLPSVALAPLLVSDGGMTTYRFSPP